VHSHAFTQSQLSWLLNRLALVSGQQFAQLWINALLLSVCSASQHSCMNAMHSKHIRSYIALEQCWEPEFGEHIDSQQGIADAKTRRCVLSLPELSALIQVSFNSQMPCSVSQLHWTKNQRGICT